MSALQANPFLMAGGDDGYKIKRSLRFNSGDSAYTSRICGYPTTSGIWTLSCWVKRTKLGSDTTLFSARSGSNAIQIYFPSNDKLRFYDDGSRDMYTDAVFRDTSAWYHIVVTRTRTVNSIYVNGVLSKSTTYSSSYNSNANTNGASQSLGMLYFVGSATGYYGNMYIADPHFIDGQALAPTNFGETDDNGVWQPIEYLGTFGANGWHYKFDNNSSTSTLGTDSSGNGNNTSCNNISVAAGAGNDSLRDSPSQIADQSDSGAGGQVISNYATLNPLDHYGSTFTNGNLEASIGGGGNCGVYGNIGITSGKYYWEVKPVTIQESSIMIGIADLNKPLNQRQYYDAHGWAYYSYNGHLWHNTNSSSFGASYSTSDVLGFAANMDAGTVAIYKNNSLQGTITGLSGKNIVPYIGTGSSQPGQVAQINFGQRPFTYTAPSGYKCLCTASLPDPTIADGSQYFEAKTYTGNGGTNRAVTGLNFSPDLVWIKTRNNSATQMIADSVRGPDKLLSSNATFGESTVGSSWQSVYGSLNSFDSNGFTVSKGSTSSSNFNGTNQPYIAWAWDAGSSTVTNTSGSITSQVRANPSAGFSICTYTSPNSSSNQSFGHGLNAKPDLILVKNRDSAYNWDIYHSSLGYNSSLIFTSASTRSGAFSSEPSSTVVNTKHNYTHYSTNKYVAFCWTAVEGYSFFGTYQGNGQTDGPFVYTGFRPRYILVKASSSVAYGNWVIHDTGRSIHNVSNTGLYANLSNAEDSSYWFDILSNGFKIRSNAYDGTNGNTKNYIVAAFSEHPFKTARAR